MMFDGILAQTLEILRCKGRVSDQALKRWFTSGEATPEDLKAETVQAKKLTRDEESWAGPGRGSGASTSPGLEAHAALLHPVTPCQHDPHKPECAGRGAEARHGLVCRPVIDGRRWHKPLTQVLHDVLDGVFEPLLAEVHRVEGTINQFTGDGIMALFGAPLRMKITPSVPCTLRWECNGPLPHMPTTCAAPAESLWPCASGCMPVQWL